MFCSTFAHAEHLAQAFNAAGISTGLTHGTLEQDADLDGKSEAAEAPCMTCPACQADVPLASREWPIFWPAEIACRGTGKLLINEPSLDKLQALHNQLAKPLNDQAETATAPRVALSTSRGGCSRGSSAARLPWRSTDSPVAPRLAGRSRTIARKSPVVGEYPAEVT